MDEAKIISPRNIGSCEHGTQVKVLDEPGAGGACHEYAVMILGTGEFQTIRFQEGPLKETEPNGIFMEDLLKIVEHRLEGFQGGEFSCRENALALTKVQEALHWLNHRTQKRKAAGVEGTNQK